MNTNLKKLAKGKNGKNIVISILLVIVMVCFLVGAIVSLGSGEETPYTANSKEGDRAYVDAQYASEYFAEFTVNAEDKFYFVWDEQFNAYIVCVSDSEIEAYRDLQAYTFGVTDVPPEIVRVTGTLVPMEDQLIEFAVEEINWFYGEDVVTEATAEEFFGGAYYIDTAASDISAMPYVLIVIAIALAVVLVILWKKNTAVSSASKQVLAALEANGEAALVDAELQNIRTKHFDQVGVYLTDNYLISYRNSLAVIPLAEMTGLYGVVTEKNYELVVRGAGEIEQVVVKTENKVNRQWDELAALVTAISSQVPDLEYGVDRVKVEGTFEVTQVEHFFMARNSASALEVQTEMVNADGTVVTPNYGLGVIGALIGALIGGVLWVAVGKLGYIAGIIGFVIIYLSAMGFRKGAKVLTRGGAVISVVISMVMIFLANYVLYALTLVEAFEGRYTLGEAMTILIPTLSEYDLMGDFVKDIVIGYALSLVAAFSTLKTLLGKKK